MKMKNYVVEEKYRFSSTSTSDGTQEKYCKNNYFYKLLESQKFYFANYILTIFV